MAKGIDVHGDKGAVDWPKVKNAGYSFAFVKASEGLTFKDGRFDANRKQAKAAGLKVAGYHFARPDLHTSLDGARQEADEFMSVAHPVQGELLPVLDLEEGSPSGAWTLAFLKRVESKIGRKPILYTFPAFLSGLIARSTDDQLKELRKYPLWFASYGVNDGKNHGFTEIGGFDVAIHQYTSNGSVPGVGGDVDLNHRETSSWWPLLWKRPYWEVVADSKVQTRKRLIADAAKKVPRFARRFGKAILRRRWLAR